MTDDEDEEAFWDDVRFVPGDVWPPGALLRDGWPPEDVIVALQTRSRCRVPRPARSQQEAVARRMLARAILAWEQAGGASEARTLDADNLADNSADPLAAAMVQVLRGLHLAAYEQDAHELTAAKTAPVRWARKYDSRTHAQYASRAEEARALIAWIGEILDREEDGLNDSAIRLIVDRAIREFMARGQRSGLTPHSPSCSWEDIETRMNEGLGALARIEHDAKAVAVALLVAWGVSRARARNILKDKDA